MAIVEVTLPSKPNRKLHNYIKENSISHFYEEDEGEHDWCYWSKHLEPSIKWVSE
ncbi:MAG TPA: hypothetical protein VHQ24_04235 [Lachnospiraceae bacterium]|nr:hypothetical protein [Lachnospiraceae bacterium]HEX3076057.1 hypothetical protein [Lachnospiraceae bacterium]